MPPLVSDVMDPPRCTATVRLPCQAVPAICGLHAGHDRSNGEGSQAGVQNETTADHVTLVVVTADGKLYEYSIQQLASLHPRCVLERGRHLLARVAQR